MTDLVERLLDPNVGDSLGVLRREAATAIETLTREKSVLEENRDYWRQIAREDRQAQCNAESALREALDVVRGDVDLTALANAIDPGLTQRNLMFHDVAPLRNAAAFIRAARVFIEKHHATAATSEDK